MFMNETNIMYHHLCSSVNHSESKVETKCFTDRFKRILFLVEILSNKLIEWMAVCNAI